jgi:hypothetical protein
MNYSLPDTSAGLFVAKYNTNGICQWAVMLDAKCTNVFTESYATCDIDEIGNLYVAGNFRGTNTDFNPLGTTTTLTSSGITDIFIAKYSTSNGILSWVKKIGGAAGEIISPGSLRCDLNANPYFTGRLSGTGIVDFDPSAGTTNITNSSLYLTTFDSNGNLRYAVGMNSGAGDGGHRVSFDSNNNVYVAGWMNGTATFGTISRTANSTTADVFIAKYNNNLTTCYWAFNFGGTGSSANNICAGLSVDQENNAIITGQLYGTNADIDPSAATLNFSSIGNNDSFVIKYNSSGQLWVNNITGLNSGNNKLFQNGVQLSPNPTSDYINLKNITVEDFTYNIYNSLGELVNSGQNNTKINVSNLQNGFYIFEFIDNSKNTVATTRFVKL